MQRRNYIQGCNFTTPRDYSLSLNVERISYELNKDWVLDLIPKINILNSVYHFVNPKLREKYILHNAHR